MLNTASNALLVTRSRHTCFHVLVINDWTWGSLAGIVSHAKAPQIVEERGTLGYVAVKHDDIVLGPGESCVEVLELFTQQHIRLICGPGNSQSTLVCWLRLNLQGAMA